MKLVEVVFLIGSHCVSPIEHAVPLTEVFKVQCAVVVERDTTDNSIVVTPATEASNPLVIAAMARLQAVGNAPSTPAPAQGNSNVTAPAPEIPQVVQAIGTSPPPEGGLDTTMSEPSQAISQGAALTQIRVRPEVIGTNIIQEAPIDAKVGDDAPVQTEAALDEEEPRPKKLKTKSRAGKIAKKYRTRVKKVASGCGSGRKAVWYTNKDGRRKYRCQRSGLY